jgi:hypothetical protein
MRMKKKRLNYDPLIEDLRKLRDPEPPCWMILLLWGLAGVIVAMFWAALYGCALYVGWIK